MQFFYNNVFGGEVGTVGKQLSFTKKLKLKNESVNLAILRNVIVIHIIERFVYFYNSNQANQKY